MSGKKGGIEITILQSIKTKKPDIIDKIGDGVLVSLKTWLWNLWDFCQEDPNRVIFSFKVGLAVLLVSLLILFRTPYKIFGNNIIWSILTVVITFEYTVGATFNRGFNRALGSLLAGILAIIVAQIALYAGRVAEPFIIGISIFVIGAVTSFIKLWPSFVPFEYGFRVILFTYCLIIISGYRRGNPIMISIDRLYYIVIGGFVAVFVNVLFIPIWAGEHLHKELVNSFCSVADSLEECVRKYLDDDGLDHPEFSKTVMDEFPDEPAYHRCRETLNSSAKLESLAQSAKWEPPHGKFQHFFYPWSEYVKVGAVLRYCAYEVMALHGVLHSEIQASCNLRVTFRAEIQDTANQAAELVRSLGKDIGDMKRGIKGSLLKRVHISAERLQNAIDIHSYLLTSHQELKLSYSLSLKQSGGLPADTAQNPFESYHEMMRKQSRRLYSWPSREVDSLKEEGGLDNVEFIPKLKALESTASLSLATFASLLIEFVARLDHLVEAVDGLSKMAKFKSEAS